ncbi:MAG: hypothetical protein AABW46_00615, partial [Nanoarchaeota archaeon]
MILLILIILNILVYSLFYEKGELFVKDRDVVIGGETVEETIKQIQSEESEKEELGREVSKKDLTGEVLTVDQEKGFASERIGVFAGEICDIDIGDGNCIINLVHNVDGANFDYVTAGYTNLIFQNGGKFTTTAENTFNLVANNIEIQSGGSIEGNVEITASNLNIQSGGSINVNGKGFASQTGPGAGEAGPDSGGGAGYGGVGRAGTFGGAGGSAYGLLANPTDFGSGGGSGDGGASGGRGGGRVSISVTNNLNINGLISANGNNGGTSATGAGGGGSGGSVLINAGTITGVGNINVNGGNGANGLTSTGGAGAGGRVAIYYASNSFNDNNIQVSGGSSNNGGGSGAIYKESQAQTNALTGGDLIVNSGPLSNIKTPINETIFPGKRLENFIASGNADVSFALNDGIFLNSLIINNNFLIDNSAVELDNDMSFNTITLKNNG